LEVKTKIYLFIYISLSNWVAQLVQWLCYEPECWRNRDSSVSVVVMVRTEVLEELE